MKMQVSELYTLGPTWRDLCPDEVCRKINDQIQNGWRVVSMATMSYDSKDNVLVVYEKDTDNLDNNTGKIQI